MPNDLKYSARIKSINKVLTTAALSLSLVGTSFLPSFAAQLSNNVVKIGVLTDMTGPFADLAGQGSVVAAQLAVEDFLKSGTSIKVEVVSADHLSKADVGGQIARRWWDAEGVDMIADITNSAVALAVQSMAREQNKVIAVAAVGSTAFTGAQCSKTGFQWLHDSYNLVAGPVRKLVAQGDDSWYFIAADYAFGRDIVKESIKLLEAAGGTSKGAVFHPTNNSDYASFLLQAQSSGAKVVAFGNAGGQLVSSMKQWKEFGMDAGTQKPVAELMFLTDVHAMGAETAQGLNTVTAWYWDLNDESRAFGKRFYERRGAMPTAPHASVYSMVLHYLRSVEAAGTDATDAVVEKMRSTPVNDFFAPGARLREDGKLIHDFYLMQVKTPEEMKGQNDWALYNVVEKISADEAYIKLAESDCPLVKKSN